MDQRSFDRLARVLGEATDRRAGLRAALGALLGAGGAAAALDGEADAKNRRGKAAAPEADRKRRKKTCKPACGSGFDCVKVGKSRECACATGVTCGEACCRVGQVCEGGACVPEPEPAQCIPAGEPCKNAGRACCDDRVCASGQAGLDDVGCYRPKTGACATTADCVYGTRCEAGRCAGLPQPDAGCQSAAECPAPSDTCKEAACVAGACQVVGKADGATCATGRCSSGACTGCATDAQCAGEAIAKVCNTQTNACVQCVSATSCGGGTPYCSQSNTCVQCVSANNCSGATPYCSSYSNTCVECVTASNCGGGTPFCVGNVCAATCSEIRTTSPGTFSFPNGIATGGDYVWVTNTRGTAEFSAPWVTKLSRATGAVVSEGKAGWEAYQYLQGIAVGTDGVPLAVDYADGTSLTWKIYKVNADGSRGAEWYSFVRLAAMRPYGIYIDGTATNGTVWVTADYSGSGRKLLKFTAAAGVVTLASTFENVCVSGFARQVAMSGRTGDPYVYVACDTDNAVSVIDPATGARVKQITGATKVIGLAFDGSTNTMFTGDSTYPGGGTVRTWSLSGVGGSLVATAGCLSPQLATNPFITMLAGNGDGTQVWVSVFDPGKVVKVAFAAP